MLMDILNQPNFQRVAAVLRVPFWGISWRKQHADLPFMTLWGNSNSALDIADRDGTLAALVSIITAVAQADERLRTSVDDMKWLATAFDAEHWVTTIALLLAYASAPDVLFTPSELAAVTASAESTWRRYAAEGIVIGSIKKGKQWLLPQSILLSQQLLTKEQADRISNKLQSDTVNIDE